MSLDPESEGQIEAINHQSVRGLRQNILSPAFEKSVDHLPGRSQ